MRISYDKIADVLYIGIKDRPGIADEVNDGNFIRYDLAGEIVGITIMDFKERFIDPPDTGGEGIGGGIVPEGGGACGGEIIWKGSLK